MKRTIILGIALATTAPAAATAPTTAKEPTAAKEWEFIVNPYFMAPSIDGDLGVGPFDARVDASPSDVFSQLNWGVMGAVEANNGEWGLNLDVNYLNVDATDDGNRRFSVNGHQAAYTATVLRRVHPYAWVYAGARLSDMGVALDCNTNCPVAGDRSARRDASWVEFLGGFRATLPIDDRFDVTVNADVGGFGIGSEISVNAWPQLGVRIGERSRALIGYRLIYVKHESGDGSSRFVYDALTFGPTIGVEFRF